MREALDKVKLNAVYDRAAGRYDFQHAFLTARSDHRGRKLVVEKVVKPGDRVLDCGSGTGSTGLMAAQKVGDSGKVVLFDLSSGMLEVAKQRAARARILDRLKFAEGDMLDLPFEDDQFDCALSTYSMCPVYDPIKAVAELCRVTKPGGRIGIAHSADPDVRLLKWMADKIEDVVWRIPSISLGCRSVAVLPELQRLGCDTIFTARIGVPLWPFLVLVVVTPRGD